MKKIGYLFLFLFTLISCSNDDNSSKQITQKTVETKLKLTASSTSVLVGEEVTFNTTNDKGEVIDGELVANSYNIKAVHAFDQPGQYTVKSIKKGYEQSNEITVNVSLLTLSLRISKSEITTGQKVTFEVYAADKLITDNVNIFLEGQDTPLTKNEFTTKKEGEYSFIAKIEGYNDSQIVKLKVLEDPAPYGNFLLMNDDKFELDSFYLTIDVMTVNNKIVNKVVKTPAGELANLYSLTITNKPNDKAKRSSILVDILVVNPTIKADKDGNILDYGTRALPSNKSKVIVNSVYSFITGYDIVDMSNNIHESILKIRNFTVEETGVKGKYNGKAELQFNYTANPKNPKNLAKSMDLQFNGNTYIREYNTDKK